ncbi:MAG: glutamine-hydrolyzing GMP synthase [Bacteroidetes bacterium]|nr:glutamine-hydrolyzing GMP synthase [Bacteroidota bacterium]
MDRPSDKILILDFGSQYSQLIVRKIRELGVFSYIKPFNTPIDEILGDNPNGIIFSGGPASVYSIDSPKVDERIFDINLPILGICYGLQLIVQHFGGDIDRSAQREFGRAELQVSFDNDLPATLKLKRQAGLFKDVSNNSIVWMSHSDKVVSLPKDFSVIASTLNSDFAAVWNKKEKIFGLQFHPEVNHTTEGKKILQNFVVDICKCNRTWQPKNFIENTITEIKEKVGSDKVVCALSGGVDSTVSAVLVHEAIGDNLTCIHIDNGLMRKDESKNVVKFFQENLHSRLPHRYECGGQVKLRFVDASKIFLERLKGFEDPEDKRKIIGNTFIDVIEEEVSNLDDVKFLVQGTLYPDVIESVSVKGPSSVIKTHHNVGGLPERMKLTLIEPLRELFKDEVRLIGKELGISEEFLNRHPFPGPGLGVRILGEIDEVKLEILREADFIFINELNNFGIYHNVWQAFAVLLPVKSVGVMGDERTYENTIVLRAVTSTDGMTADWAKLDQDFLQHVSNRIVNEVRGVNRVVYDITSKPPATIEWE